MADSTATRRCSARLTAAHDNDLARVAAAATPTALAEPRKCYSAAAGKRHRSGSSTQQSSSWYGRDEFPLQAAEHELDGQSQLKQAWASASLRPLPQYSISDQPSPGSSSGSTGINLGSTISGLAHRRIGKLAQEYGVSNVDVPPGIYIIPNEDDDDGERNPWRLGDQYPRAEQEVMGQLPLPKRCDVACIEDPCHPCYNNVWVKRDMSQRHRQLVYTADLPPRRVLGLYWGEIRTQAEDEDWVAEDPTWRRAMEHGYTHNVEWAQDGTAGQQLVVVGDKEHCLMSCANEVSMWGNCRKLWRDKPPPEPCNCKRYAGRRHNAETLQGICKEGSGSGARYWPVILFVTSSHARKGDEVLLQWEDEHGSFFKTIGVVHKQYQFLTGLQRQAHDAQAAEAECQARLTATESRLQAMEKAADSRQQAMEKELEQMRLELDCERQQRLRCTTGQIAEGAAAIREHEEVKEKLARCEATIVKLQNALEGANKQKELQECLFHASQRHLRQLTGQLEVPTCWTGVQVQAQAQAQLRALKSELGRKQQPPAT